MLNLFGEEAAIVYHLFETINILIFIGVAIGVIIILDPIISIIKTSIRQPKHFDFNLFFHGLWIYL